MTAREGVIVTALMAEMIVETAIVTANWRKNWPVMPPMNAQGTNTALSTRAIARIGPGHFIHRLDRGCSHVEARGHQPLDVLQHHDGVVDHDADRQHQAEERDVVQAEPQGGHDGERADQRHGHIDHRQDHGPPVLQEHQHHDPDQHHGFQQGLEHVGDRLADERRGVVGDAVFHSVGKAGLQLFHLGLHPLGDVERVGSGELVDGKADGGVAVEGAGLVVVLAPISTRATSRSRTTASEGLGRAREAAEEPDDVVLRALPIRWLFAVAELPPPPAAPPDVVPTVVVAPPPVVPPPPARAPPPGAPRPVNEPMPGRLGFKMTVVGSVIVIDAVLVAVLVVPLSHRRLQVVLSDRSSAD